MMFTKKNGLGKNISKLFLSLDKGGAVAWLAKILQIPLEYLLKMYLKLIIYLYIALIIYKTSWMI